MVRKSESGIEAVLDDPPDRIKALWSRIYLSESGGYVREVPVDESQNGSSMVRYVWGPGGRNEIDQQTLQELISSGLIIRKSDNGKGRSYYVLSTERAIALGVSVAMKYRPIESDKLAKSQA